MLYSPIYSESRQQQKYISPPRGKRRPQKHCGCGLCGTPSGRIYSDTRPQAHHDGFRYRCSLILFLSLSKNTMRLRNQNEKPNENEMSLPLGNTKRNWMFQSKKTTTKDCVVNLRKAFQHL